MTVLRPAPVSISQFMYHEPTKTLVTEASNLPRNSSPASPFGQVFDDACDEGLTVIGQTKEIVFAVDNIEYREGDLLWWDLVPVEPGDAGSAKVRVYND